MFHAMSAIDFSGWFRERLRRRQWSQAEFSRRSQIAASTINAWFKGERTPDPESCEKIADALGIGRDEVLAVAGHREPDEPIAPDDPRRDIIARVRKIKWNQERTETILDILDRWLKFDRANAERGGG
jgi:transcriptional regulator with XRE-family HTH domain